MKVPVSWLREYVDIDLPIEELARQLVFTSCEVDRIVRRGVPGGEATSAFVVGRVLEAAKHPNADKLQLTKVDVGEGEPRSIVCGAWNFGAGATVAVVAARRRHARRRVHDREAQAARRGLRRDDPLRARARARPGPRRDHAARRTSSQPGTPLADVLPLGDDVLEIETLYNRPDLTSVYGIAREVAALTGADAAADARTPTRRATATSRSTIAIDDLDALPALHRRASSATSTVGESPAWLKARLIGAGMRPISNVVDVTNYVMLALGSPLHAFDHEEARGRPDRRAARAAGREARHARRDRARARSRRPRDRRRRAADRDRGGDGRREHRGLRRDDRRSLLETANFEPLTVLRSGERHRMRTGGADALGEGRRPARLAAHAATYASQLLAELAGAPLDGRDRGARRAPGAAVIAYRPGVRERGDRARDRRGRAARATRAARLRR